VSKLNSTFFRQKFGLQGGNYTEIQQMPLQSITGFAAIIVSPL